MKDLTGISRMIVMKQKDGAEGQQMVLVAGPVELHSPVLFDDDSEIEMWACEVILRPLGKLRKPPHPGAKISRLLLDDHKRGDEWEEKFVDGEWVPNDLTSIDD